MLKLTKPEKTICFNVVRQFIYLCIIFSFIFFMHFLSAHYHRHTFAEGGVVENLQLTLLLSSGIIFLMQIRLRPEYAPVLWLLASCSFLASCRELDRFFDHNLPIISWKIGFIFPLIAFYKAYRRRWYLKKALLRFFTSPSFYMMCCAMIIILPIAQCIGHRPFVTNVLGTPRIAYIKELFEESTEAMGYLLIFLSSIECFWSLPKTVKIHLKRRKS